MVDSDLESVTASEQSGADEQVAEVTKPAPVVVVQAEPQQTNAEIVIGDDDTAKVVQQKMLMAKPKAKTLNLTQQRSMEERCWRLRTNIVEAKVYGFESERFGVFVASGSQTCVPKSCSTGGHWPWSVAE